MIRPTRLIGIALATAFVCSNASAVILYDTATRNTTAPSGALLNSGWQYEGQWNPVGWAASLGTPIASQYFITADHLMPNDTISRAHIGDTFSFNGTAYTTTDTFKDPNSDLRIWKISGAFPSWAPLYTGVDEVGKSLVVIGRGTQRGSDVIVGGSTQGWQWGTQDGVQSWGTNVVSDSPTFAGYGPQLAFAFNALPNEGSLSTGDSGGAIFIQQAGAWKLAGINLGTDGPYKYAAADASAFNASIFDQTGLYVQYSDHNWYLAPATPGNSYATRISSEILWINSVVPEPSCIGIIAGLSLLLGRRLRA